MHAHMPIFQWLNTLRKVLLACPTVHALQNDNKFSAGRSTGLRSSRGSLSLAQSHSVCQIRAAITCIILNAFIQVLTP